MKRWISVLLCLAMLLPVCRLVLAQTEAKGPMIVLKFDDFQNNYLVSFQKTKEILDEKGVVAGFGVIGKNTTNTNSFTFLQESINDNYEIWSHGCEQSDVDNKRQMATGVIPGWTDEQIMADFADTLNRVEAKLTQKGSTNPYIIRSYGAPGNQIGEPLYAIMKEHFPQIETVMLPQKTSETWQGTFLTNRCDVESGGAVLPLETFKTNFESLKDADYVVCQGHPNSWFNPDTKDAETIAGNAENLAAIIDYLKEEGCTFVTPYQATVALEGQEASIVDKGIEVVDFYYARDGARISALSAGAVTAKIEYYPTVQGAEYTLFLAGYQDGVLQSVTTKRLKPTYTSVTTYDQQARSGATAVATYQVPAKNQAEVTLEVETEIDRVRTLVLRDNLRPAAAFADLDAQSNDNRMTSFGVTIDGKTYQGDINHIAGTVTVLVPTRTASSTGSLTADDSLLSREAFAAAVTNLTPQISLAEGAATDAGSRDFTTAQTYTVTAANGTEKAYTVAVEEAVLVRNEQFNGASMEANTIRGYTGGSWNIGTSNQLSYAVDDPVTGDRKVLKIERSEASAGDATSGAGITLSAGGELKSKKLKRYVTEVEFCFGTHTTAANFQFRMSPDSNIGDTLLINAGSGLTMYNRVYNSGSAVLIDPSVSGVTANRTGNAYPGGNEAMAALELNKWYRLKGVYTQSEDAAVRQMEYYLDDGTGERLVYTRTYNWYIKNFQMPHVFCATCDNKSRWTVYLSEYTTTTQYWN